MYILKIYRLCLVCGLQYGYLISYLFFDSYLYYGYLDFILYICDLSCDVNTQQEKTNYNKQFR